MSTCHELVDKVRDNLEVLGRPPPNVLWNINAKLGVDARENAIDLEGFSNRIRQIFLCPCAITLAVVVTETFDPQPASMYRLSWDSASKEIFFAGQVVDEGMFNLINDGGAIRLAVTFSEHLIALCEGALGQAEDLPTDESKFLLETLFLGSYRRLVWRSRRHSPASRLQG